MRSCLIWSVVMLAGVAAGCNRGPQQPPEQRKTTTDSEGTNTAQTLDRGQATQPTERDGATQKAVGGKPAGPRQELAVDLGGGVQLEFVLIPAGEFLMGDERGLDHEQPVHKVTITKPFYLGKYEVTQEVWEAVMGNNPSRFKGAKNPVELVSWQDCQDFLAKLNDKFLTVGAKFSLPSEAQWEYACRAGTTTRYSFGDDAAVLADYAWWVENSHTTTHPVGLKKPNAWGLYDMHGNVWEWCADWSAEDYFRKSPAEDPTGSDSGSSRVLRGGSWGFDFPDRFRCAYRFDYGPDHRHDYLGFRVARTLTP